MRIDYREVVSVLHDKIIDLYFHTLSSMGGLQNMLDDNLVKEREFVRGRIFELEEIKRRLEEDFGMGQEEEDNEQN